MADAGLELPAILIVELFLQIAHDAYVGIARIVGQLHGDMVILLEQLADAGQPFGCVVKHSEVTRCRRILLEASHFQILLLYHAPVIERQFASNDLHQGGLARPVAPDQTETLSALNAELGIIEQREITERQTSAVQC